MTLTDLDAIRSTTDRAELGTLIEQLTEELKPLTEQEEALQREIRPLREALYTATTMHAELA